MEVAWANLKLKYAPQTAQTEIGLYWKFYDSKLKKGMDPDVWIFQMEDTRMRLEEMKSVMLEKHFPIHLISNLTSEYNYTVALVEIRLDSTINPLTLEELRADLNLRYERLGLKKKEEDKDDKEYDVALVGFNNKFKGKCRKCSKIGHKAVDCRSNTNKSVGTANYSNEHSPRKDTKGKDTEGWTQVKNRNAKFDGVCNYCKKDGHKYADCRKRIQDQATNANHANLGQHLKNEISLMATEFRSASKNYYVSISEVEDEEEKEESENTNDRI